MGDEGLKRRGGGCDSSDSLKGHIRGRCEWRPMFQFNHSVLFASVEFHST